MILCLDYGSRYIGLAITDQDERLALRHGVIDQKSQEVILALTDLIQRENINKILVGLPVSLEAGTHTHQTRETLDFVRKLEAAFSDRLTIATVDETLTSVEAAKRIKIEGLPELSEHSEAARLMLEDYLRQR